jgi:phosphatidylglycerophosphatase A
MKISKIISTVCGLGYLPVAPGTFGSLPGLVLGLLTHHIFYEYDHFILISTIIGLAICIKGYLAIRIVEREWSHDDSRIVIDELAGQYFATVYFPVTWFYALASFALFRFFDIVKPWPIRWVDREWRHSLATLIDDLMASALAVVCLLLLSNFIAKSFL